MIEKGAFDGVTAIVHLAGAGIADRRWTSNRKKVLEMSRVDSANLIFDHLNKIGRSVDTFISASAIGYYGTDTGSVWMSEEKNPGKGFLPRLVQNWEKAADQFEQIGARVVKLRIGPVISPTDGMLSKMLPLVKLGVGAALGTGSQYLSWIHIDDLVAIITKALANTDWKGVYNTVSPSPVDNKTFMKLLCKHSKRPFIMPNVPPFCMKLILGELSDVLLGGNKVSAKKIMNQKYVFRFDNLEDSLKDVLQK